jgi:CubicO group peptidase (beta-lactamase class C family)
MSLKSWRNVSLEKHIELRDSAANSGYRYLSLSLHGAISDPRYSAVMIKRSPLVAQREWPLLSSKEFEDVREERKQQGYGLVILSATGPSDNPRFAAVFEPMEQVPLTHHRLKSGSSTDPATIQGVNKKATLEGKILRWAAAYGDEDDPRFAGIWMPDTAKTLWNTDGVLETVGEFKDRFEAQKARWSRPAFVTLNSQQRYFSFFVDNQVGPWEVKVNMTREECEQEVEKWTDESHGYLPVCMQAGGNHDETRYAAIFVKKQEAVEREFHPRGPVANAQIDKLMNDVLKNTPVRHVSLAIVHKARLVFARGYTLAEPGYPVCEPTTGFRIASVSKTITALAIYQLIEKGVLNPGDKVQEILKLKTPSGGAPTAAKFRDITIRHLLEHTSGLNLDAFRSDPAIRDAWKEANPSGSYHLPMSEERTDAYIASLPMVNDPDEVQQYCNCAYYLLGRVVAKLRNRDKPIDAMRDFLFKPLGITRIRRGRSLLADQPEDEARYQINEAGSDDDHDKRLTISTGASMMSDERPMVPVGYGDEHYEKQDGCGGLSAAATDLARIVAMLISQQDNGALSRKTINLMLNNALACQNKWHSRAGHGLDGVRGYANNRFYGQKGGRLPSHGAEIQFNQDWGHVFCISGGMAWTPDGVPTYPDFPALMNIAYGVDWGETDLFPQFGMSTLQP